MKLDDLYPPEQSELRAAFFANFWSRVNTKGPEECWEWETTSGPNCYGGVGLWGTGKKTSAHRIAYAFTHGEVADGQPVCHSCDNPPCCNPSHLWAGTQADNVQDMIRKGRARPGTGGRPRKLSDDEILEMRHRHAIEDISCVDLARDYDISRATVYRLLGESRNVSQTLTAVGAET